MVSVSGRAASSRSSSFPSWLPPPRCSLSRPGSISGKVTATDGSVLPGVTVEARSDVLPGPRVTVTGGQR